MPAAKFSVWWWDRVDIAVSDAQEAVEQSLAEGRQHIAADLRVPSGDAAA